jgi:hypothetical protein
MAGSPGRGIDAATAPNGSACVQDATSTAAETATGRSDCMNMHTWPGPAMRAHAAERGVITGGGCLSLCSRPGIDDVQMRQRVCHWC